MLHNESWEKGLPHTRVSKARPPWASKHAEETEKVSVLSPAQAKLPLQLLVQLVSWNAATYFHIEEYMNNLLFSNFAKNTEIHYYKQINSLCSTSSVKNFMLPFPPKEVAVKDIFWI